MRNNVTADLTSSLDQNTNGRQQLLASIAAVHTDTLHDSRQGRDSIMTAIQHESSHMRAEMASLRDVILTVMTGNGSSADLDQQLASRLTSSDSADLATQVGKQLIETPSSLKDVCRKMTPPEEPLEDGFDLPLRFKKRRIGCTCVREQSFRRVGPLGTAYSIKAPGGTKCSYHHSDWSYSLSVRLLPLMQRTIELTFAAKFGAGGGSIGPSLRYFGTVERVKSPAFQLFDKFPDRCARRVDYDWRKSVEDQILLSGADGRGFCFDWDLEVLEAEIPGLCNELFRLLSTGRSCAFYSDEYGNTLLHVSIHKILDHRFVLLTLDLKALICLIELLGSKFHRFSDQLRFIAELVIDAGVDVHAVSQCVSIDYPRKN